MAKQSAASERYSQGKELSTNPKGQVNQRTGFIMIANDGGNVKSCAGSELQEGAHDSINPPTPQELNNPANSTIPKKSRQRKRQRKRKKGKLGYAEYRQWLAALAQDIIKHNSCYRMREIHSLAKRHFVAASQDYGFYGDKRCDIILKDWLSVAVIKARDHSNKTNRHKVELVMSLAQHWNHGRPQSAKHSAVALPSSLMPLAVVGSSKAVKQDSSPQSAVSPPRRGLPAEDSRGDGLRILPTETYRSHRYSDNTYYHNHQWDWQAEKDDLQADLANDLALASARTIGWRWRRRGYACTLLGYHREDWIYEEIKIAGRPLADKHGVWLSVKALNNLWYRYRGYLLKRGESMEQATYYADRNIGKRAS